MGRVTTTATPEAKRLMAIEAANFLEREETVNRRRRVACPFCKISVALTTAEFLYPHNDPVTKVRCAGSSWDGEDL